MRILTEPWNAHEIWHILVTKGEFHCCVSNDVFWLVHICESSLQLPARFRPAFHPSGSTILQNMSLCLRKLVTARG